MSNGPKFQRLWHELSQILMKLFWMYMKGISEARLSRKFQHILITLSKVMIPQSWHRKLKINKTRGFRQLGYIFYSL